jgi:pimeloyl-ACP methyl ester carboxylesterase
MNQYEVRVEEGFVAVDRHGHVRQQETPLVIVPGVMSDAAGWGTVANLLARDTEVHVLNRRGRYPSSDIPTEYSLLTEVGDLCAVLAALGRPAQVFGWSLGGLVALEAAASGAEVVSLIVYEPVMAPFGDEQIRPLREARDRDDFDAMVEIVNRDISGYTQQHVDALRSDGKSWAHLRELAIPLADEIEALNGFVPDLESYSKIKTPTAVLNGTESSPVYQAHCMRIVQSLRHPVTTSLQGVDHLVHITAPNVLVEAIRQNTSAS